MDHEEYNKKYDKLVTRYEKLKIGWGRFRINVIVI